MADDTAGKVKHVGGKIQEKVGDILGDTEMQRKGQLTQVEGEAEQDESRAEDVAEEARERKTAAKVAKNQTR